MKHSKYRKITAIEKIICNLIGREEYNVGRIVLSSSILYSLTKKQEHSNSVARKNKNLLIKNKLIINYQSEILFIQIN